ncbi:uncharacterized protein LOC143615506 [Bidens hawaiensis]|uniref:uncharacterized protein LOC143615506 n=1 Tax=Bidens hawaiensis TaxID=980011 RepID=UPI0040490CB5
MGDTSNNETLISKLDPSDPLYLHPSDSSNLSIVSIKLKGTENYYVWANAMKLALQVKNKLGFVTGKCMKPTNDQVLIDQWEVLIGQVYSQQAYEVWEELRETYEKIDGSLPSCSCQASKGFNDFSQLIKLMQFLMGLDDVYQPVRTNLLTREPLPTVKVAFSVVSREESHRNPNGLSKGQTQNVGFVSKNSQYLDNKKRFSRGPNPNFKCEHSNKQFNSNNSNPNKTSSSNNVSSSLTPEQVSKLLGLLHEKSDNVQQSSNVGVDVYEFNISVKHPNGSNAIVTKIGSLKLTKDVILTDVFVVPEYFINLLSVYKLAKDNKLSILFNETNCYIQDSLTKRTLVNLWHIRLGHPAHQVLNVLKNDLKIGTLNENIPCENQFNATVKMFRSDNGTEFVNSQMENFARMT